MCTICGCGASSVEASRTSERNRSAFANASQPPHEVLHYDQHGHDHGHDHHHGHDHSHAHDRAHEHPSAERTSSGAAKRLVRVEQDILAENDRLAAGNRTFFADRGILALNLMSAPGSGKTTLLVRTLADLRDSFPMAVIEGD